MLRRRLRNANDVIVKISPEAKKMNAQDYVNYLEGRITKHYGKEYSKYLFSIRDIANSLKNSMDVSSRNKVQNIPIISFPSYEFNAYVSKPESGIGYFIFLDPRLTNSIQQFAIAMASNMGTVGLLQGYAFSCPELIQIGRVGEAFVTSQVSKWSVDVRGSALLYILAHEYAHVICDHFRKGQFIEVYYPILENTRLSILNPSQKMELEADSLALKIFLDCHGPYDSEMWNLVSHIELIIWINHAIHQIQEGYQFGKILREEGYDDAHKLLKDRIVRGDFSKKDMKRVTKKYIDPAYEKAKAYEKLASRLSTHPSGEDRISNIRKTAESLLGPPLGNGAYVTAAKHIENFWNSDDARFRWKQMGIDWNDEEERYLCMPPRKV